MFFHYIKEGDSVDQSGQITRVTENHIQSYLDEKLENGEPKYKEVTFKDWWDDAVADDTKALVTKEANAGEFISEIEDPENAGSVIAVACSLETGEPVDAEAAVAPVEAQEGSEGTEANADGATPAVEATASVEGNDGQPA